MAYTTTDLEKLEAAMAKGGKRIKYGDKETEYYSLDELLRLREIMKQDIAGVSGLADRRTMGIFKGTTNK